MLVAFVGDGARLMVWSDQSTVRVKIRVRTGLSSARVLLVLVGVEEVVLKEVRLVDGEMCRAVLASSLPVTSW